MLNTFEHILYKSMPRNAPRFLIIGVQQAATTTVFDILNETKKISGSSEKEVHFFDSDYRYKKEIDWYLSFFTNNIEQISFEATPSYMYSKKALQRIFDNFGSMKFLVMLRDPVQRCFSAWNMFRSFNKDRATADHIYETFIRCSDNESKKSIENLLFTENFPSFEQCANEDIDRYQQNSTIEEPSFVMRGLYYEQIIQYLTYVRARDFIFLEQNEFGENVEENVAMINAFFGISNAFEEGVDWSQMSSNKGDYDDVDFKVYSNTYLKLYDIYHEHNEELYKLIGRKYAWNADRWQSL